MHVIKNFVCGGLLLVTLINNSFALPISDLTNKDWILKSINGIGIHLTAYQGKKPRIKFFDDLHFVAWAGCNEIYGNYYYKEPDVFNFDKNITTTKMLCNSPQNIEDEFIHTLQAIETFKIDNDIMKLLDKNNNVLLEYILLQY